MRPWLGNPPHHVGTEWLAQHWGAHRHCGGTPVGFFAHVNCHMFLSKLVGFDRVHGVEAVLTIWVVQDEGVGVDIGDKGDQGGAPEIHTGASPTFEDCVHRDHDCGGTRVIEVDFVLVVDGCGAHRREFAGAEE